MDGLETGPAYCMQEERGYHSREVLVRVTLECDLLFFSGRDRDTGLDEGLIVLLQSVVINRQVGLVVFRIV